MMKAQEIQFDGVRMYMWCLKILASHRRVPFLKDCVVHLRLSRLVSGSERDLVACVLKRLLSGALSSGAPLEV